MSFGGSIHQEMVMNPVGGATYGIVKELELVAVKVLSYSGSRLIVGVIIGIEWVMNYTENNIKTVTANLSLGGGASAAIDTAWKNPHDSKVITVISTGNSNTNVCRISLAQESTVITVVSNINTGAC